MTCPGLRKHLPTATKGTTTVTEGVLHSLGASQVHDLSSTYAYHEWRAAALDSRARLAYQGHEPPVLAIRFEIIFSSCTALAVPADASVIVFVIASLHPGFFHHTPLLQSAVVRILYVFLFSFAL